MSVNLNILANKAIRGYADVDDISTSTQVYVSGSPYILYAVNNTANIPVTGLPQQPSYCSQSILQVSPTSDFSSAVTESYISCTSSSLSGSYLFYGSFTDNTQPGGFLNSNYGYMYPLVDSTISYNQINSGAGKTYYFRNRKIADFGYQGDWSNVSSTNLMLSNVTDTNVFNSNNFLYLWEAKGYDNRNNKWWRNYPPTFLSGSDPNNAGGIFPAPFDATASIATGSGNPQIVIYGNGGSPALKTNGATFTLPMSSSMVQNNYLLTYCIIQGSITGSSTLDNGNQIVFWADVTNNKASVQLVGAGPDEIITITPTQGVRNNPIGIVSAVSSISPTAQGNYNITCAGTTGTAQQWQSAGAPPQQSVEFRLTSPFTLETSTDCILRFVGIQPGTNTDYPEFVRRYLAIEGAYTGSING